MSLISSFFPMLAITTGKKIMSLNNNMQVKHSVVDRMKNRHLHSLQNQIGSLVLLLFVNKEGWGTRNSFLIFIENLATFVVFIFLKIFIIFLFFIFYLNRSI